eukprot:1178472-Prorocentrum_minimum.AAC.5
MCNWCQWRIASPTEKLLGSGSPLQIIDARPRDQPTRAFYYFNKASPTFRSLSNCLKLVPPVNAACSKSRNTKQVPNRKFRKLEKQRTLYKVRAHGGGALRHTSAVHHTRSHQRCTPLSVTPALYTTLGHTSAVHYSRSHQRCTLLSVTPALYTTLGMPQLHPGCANQ